MEGELIYMASAAAKMAIPGGNRPELEDGSSAISAIISLLLASPADALMRGAEQLDAAMSLVCSQLGEVDKAETWTRLAPLAHLFPRALEGLRATSSPSHGHLTKLSVIKQRMTDLPPTQDIELSELRFAPMDRLMAVADLPDLDASITAILVFRGNSEVLAKLTANSSARFARSSFTTLVELAPGDRRIKENLARRTDLPEALCLRLLPFLNHSQKVAMFVAGASINTATAANDLASERDVYLGSGVDPSRALDDTILRLCNDARISEVSEVLAERLRVPLATSMNLLCGRLDHVACLTLVAAGAGVKSIPPILNLRQRLECRKSRDHGASHDVFNRYTIEEARVLILDCNQAMMESGLVVSEFDFSPEPIIRLA